VADEGDCGLLVPAGGWRATPEAGCSHRWR
jgi:hypothetical protein